MEMEEPDCLSVAEIRAAERRNHNALNQAPSQGESLQDAILEGDQPDKNMTLRKIPYKFHIIFYYKCVKNVGWRKGVLGEC